MQHEQINVRVPLRARDLVKAIARDIREVPGFVDRLERWMNEAGDERAALFTERMDRMNRRVSVLEERLSQLSSRLDGSSGAPTVASATPPAIPAKASPGQVDMFPSERGARSAATPAASASTQVVDDPAAAEESDGRATAQPSQWTTGEGRARRMTAEGKAEMERRIDAGQSDREIADFLGVKPFSVANTRKGRSTGASE